MLERRDETDDTESERVRLDGESKELIADGVGAIGMLVTLLLEPGVETPSDSTRTMSYCPTSLEATVGRKKDVSKDSSTPGRIVELADGVYSNRLEAIDCCGLEAYDTSDTGLDLVLRVELGGGTGGIKKETGVRKEVVTLLNDLEEADIGVGKGDAVTLEALDAVLVLREETEETVVDLGWRLTELWLEIERGAETPFGVLIGVPVGDLLAKDIVRDWVGVTLLSDDNVAEVTLISLMASGMLPTTEGVGVPRIDRIIGVETEGVDTRALAGRIGVGGRAGDTEAVDIRALAGRIGVGGTVDDTEGVDTRALAGRVGVDGRAGDMDNVDARAVEDFEDGNGGKMEDWVGDDPKGTVAYSEGLDHLIALEYSVELST